MGEIVPTDLVRLLFVRRFGGPWLDIGKASRQTIRPRSHAARRSDLGRSDNRQPERLRQPASRSGTSPARLPLVSPAIAAGGKARLRNREGERADQAPCCVLGLPGCRTGKTS
jgi:hypothetical protein